MRREVIAAKYGKALYELAREAKTQDQIYAEIKLLAQVMTSDEGLADFADTPLVKAEAKEDAVAMAIQSLSLSQVTKNFVLTLARRDRLTLLGDVETAFLDQMDKDAGLTRGTVVSAAELNDAQKKDITAVLSKITGKKVAVTFKKESKIGGGLSAQVGGLTIDDSVQTHLKRMQDELNRRTH